MNSAKLGDSCKSDDFCNYGNANKSVNSFKSDDESILDTVKEKAQNAAETVQETAGNAADES